MSAGLTQIYNLALSACGSGLSVSDVAERSREAELCRLWYTTTRDAVLSAAPWPSVRRYERLARVVERDFAQPWLNTDPDPGYGFSFALPASLLIPYHLQSFMPFSYGNIGGVRMISKSDTDPILYYNSREVDPAEWEQPLVMAVVYSLAFHLAKPLTGRGQTQQVNGALAEEFVESARLSAANAQSEKTDVLPDWIAVRGYGDGVQSRFYFPLASFNLAVSK